MGIVVKQSIRTIAVTIVGAILGVLINLLSVKYFVQTDFGFTQNLVKIALLFNYLGSFGFATTFVVYGQKFDRNHPKRSSFITLSILVPTLITLLVTLGYFLFKSTIIHLYHSGDEYLMDRYFVLFPLLTIFSVMLSLQEGYLQSLHKTALQSFAREVLNRVVYLALVFMYGYSILNFDQFIWWYTILYLIPIAYLFYYIFKYGGFKTDWNINQLNRFEKRQIILFSFNQTLVVLVLILIQQVDTLLIGPLSVQGFEAVAIYGIAMFAISVMRNPIRAIGLAAFPSLSKSYNNIQLKELRTNFNKSTLSIQLLVVYCCVALFVGMPEIQALLNEWKEGYELVGALILIMIIGNGIDLMGGLTYELIALSKYYKYNTIFAFICLLIIVGLIYFWISPFGLVGVAWASTCGLIVYAVMKSLLLLKKFKIKNYSHQTLQIILIGACSGILPYFIQPTWHPIIVLGIKGIVLSIIFIFLIYKFKILLDFNNAINKMLHKYK